jgi:transcriptional regulator with XRE-family HTH domain
MCLHRYNRRMFTYDDSSTILRVLGNRIRSARIRRGDQQKVFAYRIGVSIPTLRDLEEGKPTVSIGAFMNALEAVGHLEDMAAVMAGVSTDKKRVRKTAQCSLSR